MDLADFRLLQAIFLITASAALLLLAARKLLLWYWRIDRAVSALEDIATSLRTLIDKK